MKNEVKPVETPQTLQDTKQTFACKAQVLDFVSISLRRRTSLGFQIDWPSRIQPNVTGSRSISLGESSWLKGRTNQIFSTLVKF